MAYSIRKATFEDRDRIEQLIAQSARGLSREDYSDAQIEAAIATVFGVDTDLIEDGTYFVVESDDALAGCGGWSRRKTLFGGDQFTVRDATYLDPETEPAKIRAFFVHPDHARKGVAKAILERCEAEAAAYSFRAMELMATMPGVKFYQACGYVEQGDYDLELIEGVKLELVPMRKELEGKAADERK
jgi:GNAT superfamily N-acetyltransferase